MANLFFFFFFFFFFFIQHAACQLPPVQLTAMNTLHNTTISKWNSSQNPCSWTGVSCAPNHSAITSLALSSFSLSNPPDSWFSLVCQIDTLQSLDLSANHLTSIPPQFIASCGGITGLRVLNFSNNRLTGSLPTFQGFASLQVLDLSLNSFTESIGLQFDGLNALRSLNVSANSFSGSVPTRLGNSMLLEELQLSINGFQGVIPDEIASYRNLTLLDLRGNLLTGAIPLRIGQLSRLQQLLLSANQLTDEMPQSISGIVTLKRFAANQNHFTGAIPQGISRHLMHLDLSYNNLNGSIPTDLLAQPNLQTVDLSFNMLEGSIPPNASATLVRLRLGNNRLSGPIPSWSLGEDVPSLTYLEVNHNSLSGMIPTELSLCKNLSLLDLSHNNLSGFIPPELGKLNRLQVVLLQHNNLSGEIPDEITQLQMLQKLNMSWNLLNGSIPSALWRLQKLMNLDLQANDLSGGIPDSIHMDSLLELQIGENQLGGFVRSMPMKLQIGLNLSHNNFIGPIPTALSRLYELEVLDLSNNRFSGGVPSFLTQMPSLTRLLLSNNMLSGFIPQFNPHVIWSASGNPKLFNRTSDPSAPVPKKKNSVSVGIVAASAAAVFALATFVLVAILVSRRIHKLHDSSHTQIIIKSSLLTGNVIHRSNLDFTKAIEAAVDPSNLVLKTRFSTYHKAVMPSGMHYFVKELNRSDKIFQIGSQDLFEQELQALGKLRNSSVMTPLAYALTTESAYLFYEFTEKGTLFDVLHGNGLDWTNRYSIAIGVAHGLSFLHECPIILLDLSSRAVMLKSLNEPQIGDIELFKVIDPSKSTSNLSTVAGSIGYIPPEYAYTMRVTMAGNVYSFGVILLELLTGKPAVSEGSELAKWALGKSQQQNKLEQILDSGVSRASPVFREQMLAVLRVALACVSVSPEARPKMKSVLRMLLNASLMSHPVTRN